LRDGSRTQRCELHLRITSMPTGVGELVSEINAPS
jgi:hypothetical protein